MKCYTYYRTKINRIKNRFASLAIGVTVISSLDINLLATTYHTVHVSMVLIQQIFTDIPVSSDSGHVKRSHSINVPPVSLII